MRYRWIAVAAAACANGHSVGTAQDAAPIPDAPVFVGTTCPAGSFATDVDASNQVHCSPIDGATQRALDSRCSIYLGWRDGCDGCTTDPAKWGYVGGAGCVNGTGQDDTCSMATLGSQLVPLFGLNPDGDVDGNDKIYTSLHCVAGDKQLGFAPCPADQFVTGTFGTSYVCEALGDFAVSYVSANCSLYLGWQDNCDGCVTMPAKWGVSGDAGCANGSGADDTCSIATFVSERVNLFGLSPDGDVDGNDKLHVGLSCKPASAMTGTGTMACPDGELVTGVNADGSVACASPAPAIAQYFADHCTLYFGWRDSCDGCTDPPAKWGWVKLGDCANGAGADDTCTTFQLGSDSIQMFGLNPDGNVDGNDKLYVGFTCH